MPSVLKPLEWKNVDYHHAVCPVTDLEFSIHFEEGRYWGAWRDCGPEGRDTLEEVKNDAELRRNAIVAPHLCEPSVETAAKTLMAWSKTRRWGVAAAKATFEGVLKRALKAEI